MTLFIQTLSSPVAKQICPVQTNIPCALPRKTSGPETRTRNCKDISKSHIHTADTLIQSNVKWGGGIWTCDLSIFPLGYTMRYVSCLWLVNRCPPSQSERSECLAKSCRYWVCVDQGHEAGADLNVLACVRRVVEQSAGWKGTCRGLSGAHSCEQQTSDHSVLQTEEDYMSKLQRWKWFTWHFWSAVGGDLLSIGTRNCEHSMCVWIIYIHSHSGKADI